MGNQYLEVLRKLASSQKLIPAWKISENFEQQSWYIPDQFSENISKLPEKGRGEPIYTSPEDYYAIIIMQYISLEDRVEKTWNLKLWKK